MIDTSFRYWISFDKTQAVAVLMDSNGKWNLFSVDVQEAKRLYQDSSRSEAIYKVAIEAFTGFRGDDASIE